MTAALPFSPMQPAKLDIAQIPSSTGTVVAQLTGKLSPGDCQRLFAGAAAGHRRQAGPEHERGQLSRFRRRWRAGPALRPPKKQIAEVCAGRSYSTRRCGHAGFWPGEAPADLRYSGRSLRSLVAARKNVRNFWIYFQAGYARRNDNAVTPVSAASTTDATKTIRPQFRSGRQPPVRTPGSTRRYR